MEHVFKALAFGMVVIAMVLAPTMSGNGIVEVTRAKNFAVEDFKMKSALQDSHKANKLIDPVVMLVTRDADSSIYASGTGFSVKYDKKTDTTYFLTNHHICSDVIGTGRYITAKPSINHTALLDPSVESFEYNLQYVFSDKGNDLCLLSLDGRVDPVKFAEKNPAQMDDLKVVGAPSGVFPVIIESYFSGYSERMDMGGMEGKGREYLIISGIFHGGISGSPVYNKSKEVVGIMFAMTGKPGPMGIRLSTYGGIAIQKDDILDFLESADLD